MEKPQTGSAERWSFASRSLKSQYIGEFCVVIAGILLLLLAIGQLVARIGTMQSLFIVAAAIVMLSFALLYWWLKTHNNLFAEGRDARRRRQRVPDIADPQLRDRYIVFTELVRQGLLEADRQTIHNTLFAPREGQLVSIPPVGLNADKKIEGGPVASLGPLQNSSTQSSSAGATEGTIPASTSELPDQWADPVLNRVDDLRLLPRGWLNGDGLPLSPHILNLGYAIGSRLSVVIPMPVGIFPTVEGGMQFEWTRENGSLVTIQILPDSSIEVAETSEGDAESRQEIINGRDVVNFVREIVETVGQ